jgi:cell division protein FtsQ
VRAATAAILVVPRAVARMPRLVLARPRHWRRRLIALVLIAGLLTAGYFLWFRHSSLARVERVTVTGLATTPGAAQLRSSLTESAKRMSTLDLDAAELNDIVAHYPVVHSIELRPDFPHGLTITVTENTPVALVSAGDRSVPVAADGTLLENLDTHAALPTIRTTAIPSSRRVPGGGTLDRVAVAAAAPAALRAKVSSITIEAGHGFVAHIADGPDVWLGDGARLRLKWEAATSILAQESSQGASYIDVRIPERGVAGGLPITTEPQPDPSDAAPTAPTAPDATTPAAPTEAAPVAPTPEATTPVTPATTSETPAPTAVTPSADPQPSLQP